jgi:hypothetical protein
LRIPFPPIKFRQLEYFVAGAEESKFTHAAGRLPVSPTAVQQANSTREHKNTPMSFLESDSTDQKTQAGARHNRCIVSLILLAADLRVIVGRRGFGKLTVIVKELEAINATYVQQPRRNPGFSRYIE